MKPMRNLAGSEASSISKRGMIVKSRHHTIEMARKRLAGVRRHDGHRLIEHTQINGVPATRVHPIHA